MQINWVSQTGRERAHNCDLACCCVAENLIVMGLVDAAESQKAPAFANHWAKTIVAAAYNIGFNPDSTGIVDILSKAQKIQRHSYLNEIASYCLVVVDRCSGEGIVLSAGDCLVGLAGASAHQDYDVKWINSPHTADVPLKALGEPTAATSDFQHLLTRSINAKRFTEPETNMFWISTGSKLILASDGYWRERESDTNTEFTNTTDDASCLTLTWRTQDLAINQKTDTENLLILPTE